MKSATFLSALFASLAAVASAGQRFSFQNPIASGSYGNSMFESVSLYPGNPATAASFKNTDAGNVTLTVDDFSSLGTYLGSSSVTAKYYLAKTSANSNDLFSGPFTSASYATGSGRVVFVNPSDESQVYLQVGFTKSALSYGSFSASQAISFSGSLFDTTESGNENASFSFLDRYTSGGNTSTAHHTGTFLASIGTLGTVQATPEPASLVGFALGCLVLRRRRLR